MNSYDVDKAAAAAKEALSRTLTDAFEPVKSPLDRARKALGTIELALDDAKAAAVNLASQQRQLDAYGIEVGVSRQAVDEVVKAFLSAHDEALAALQSPQGGGEEQDSGSCSASGKVGERANAPSAGVGVSEPDYYPSHEALCDLVSLQSEHWALNGGGPGWETRWQAALVRANDIVRIEP